MRQLWLQAEKVPDSIRRLEVGVRIALLGMDEVRELQWIAQEKNGRVVANKVIVAILRVEFDRKSSGFSNRICPRSRATVENLTNVGVDWPGFDKKRAFVQADTSLVTVNTP